MKTKWQGRIALITGASSGIGEAIGRRLASEGLYVLLTERVGVSSSTVADRVWELIQRPRRVIYVPRHLLITPW